MVQPTYQILVGVWGILHQTLQFGNPTFGKISTMDEALRAVQRLNQRLQAEIGIALAVSAHMFHELTVTGIMGADDEWNNPRGITLVEWMSGFARGDYPPIGRIIPPGFGFPLSDNGAFINPDPAVRAFCHRQMVSAFDLSRRVKEAGAGPGGVIYWTGPDGLRWQRMAEYGVMEDPVLSYQTIPKMDEWEAVVRGVGEAIKESIDRGYIQDGDTLLIEGKPGGDPCYLDVFLDHRLTALGIHAINEIAGANIAKWQGEFAHERGAGITFAEAMRYAIGQDQFDGQIHLNSGGLAGRAFNGMLSYGTPMSQFQQYVDNDLLPSQGVHEWIEDQVASLEVGVKWSAVSGKPFQVEFDARFCRYLDTIGMLEGSTCWTAKHLDLFGAKPLAW